ncbi:MAG: glucodextranase DOMON-like domain-containing protein [Infirmifilum sp.]
MSLHKNIVGVFLLLVLITTVLTPVLAQQQSNPLYVAFIWHYHQPWYYDVSGSYFILPWTRMHTVGNYYKMAYILSKYPNIKVTFTFSGSLIQQIIDYNNGVKDYRQMLSEKIAQGQSLTVDEKFAMLSIPNGFFDVNWNRIVNVVPRFRELRDKAQSALSRYVSLPEREFKTRVVAEFSDQDFLDLAVLFNLFWIDPEVLREQYPDVYQLRQQAVNGASGFTRQQLQMVLNVHKDLLAKVLPFYANLARKAQIELIPVPYSHPLAPILADFGLIDDVKLHVSLSTSLFQKVFGYKPVGIWPAEQAVNGLVLSVFAGEGYTWTVTDGTLLGKAGLNPSDPSVGMKAWYATPNGSKIYVFFRNTELSNLISFQYSNQDPRQAAQDLLNRLLNMAKQSDGTNIVVIALDGENPWENYQEFGDTFLESLYSGLSDLQSKGLIITITPQEYLSKLSHSARELPLKTYRYLDLAGRDISDIPLNPTDDAYSILPRRNVTSQIPEGSWAGGELTIWIGQRQENAAWMLLIKTRQDVLRALGVKSLKEALTVNPKATEDILRAEASDWTWWYGGDGGGTFPANPLYKGYLTRAYIDAGLTPPDYLVAQFNPDATPAGVLNTNYPKPPTTEPSLDGKFKTGEWAGALNASLGDKLFTNILVWPSSRGLYIAAIPTSKATLGDPSVAIAIYTTSNIRSVSPYHPGFNSYPRYSKTDIGMGLFYEILIYPANKSMVISAADGNEKWTPLFYMNAAVDDVIEVFVPWTSIGLSQGELFYLTAASYKSLSLQDTASRLGSVYQLVVPRATALGAGAKVVFDMNDPTGDDDGAGGYKYPKADVFVPGVFDLTRFRVVDQGSTLRFEVYVKDLGGNPWGGPNGFCLQYPHIYIHTTSKMPGRTDTFGLNVNLTADSAWHIAILLAPGWGSDPVPNGEKSAIYFADGSVIVQDDKFKVYADPATNSIVAEVAKDVLPDADNASKWVYTVAVTSFDGYGNMRIRPFGLDPDVWVVGAGAKHAKAVLFNVLPRIMDLLAPTAQDQYAQLNSYVADKNGTLAKIHGVSSAATTPPQQCVCPQPQQPTCPTNQTAQQPTCPPCPAVTQQPSISYQELYRSLIVGLLAGALIGVATALLIRREGKKQV